MSWFYRWTARAALASVLVATTLAGNIRPLQPRAASAFQEQPPFTDISASAGVEQLSSYVARWGDVDNDGDLDFVGAGLLTSQNTPTLLRLYENNGGAFSVRGVGLPALSTATVPALDWGDYDGDGDLDLAISGDADQFTTRYLGIYQNVDGAFVKLAADLPQLGGGSLDWGDYDGDGDLDLLVTGMTEGPDGQAPSSQVLRNDGPTPGGWAFRDSLVELVAVWGWGQTSWGDYDADGDLDILISGRNDTDNSASFGAYTWHGAAWGVYRNDGARASGRWNFIPVGAPHPPSPEEMELSAEWGDYNGDGLLDVIVSPASNGSPAVYRNTGSALDDELFVREDLQIPWLINGEVEWGDYDGDGDLDLAYVGGNDTTHKEEIRIYRNDEEVNGRSFVDIGAGMEFTTSFWGGITWGDYDGDGDLDLLNPAHGLYRNDIGAQTQRPQPPTALSSTVVSNTVRLSWTPPPSAMALTYNLRVGTTPGGTNIVPSMTISASGALSDGLRLLPQRGNVDHVTSITLTLAPNATYYWSVQAVDASFEGSSFALEQTFTTGAALYGWAAPVHDFATVENYDYLTPDYPPPVVAWGDGDGDGDFDRAIVGNNWSDVQQNTGDPAALVIHGPGRFDSYLSWVDYNGDGGLDLMRITSSQATLMRNMGDLTFAHTNNIFPFFADPLAEWGDFDNDGDLDLLLAGNQSSPKTVLLRNGGRSAQGGWTFTRVSTNLPGLGLRARAEWGDYDNDGDLDLLLADAQLNAVHAVYRNDGPGLMGNWRFRALPSTANFIPRTDPGDATWADYDSDGDLDIAISDWNRIAVYRNDGLAQTGGWRWTLDERTVITALNSAYLSWADYDADGDLDLAASGQVANTPLNQGRTELRIYRNESLRAGTTSTFLRLTDIDVRLPSVDESRPVWVDFDGDGFVDLDLPALGLYRNVGGTRANTPPTAPTRLRAVRNERSVTFTWRPGGDQETLAPGLTYNLRIGTTPGGSQIMPPMSITAPGAKNGARMLPELGNALHGLSITLKLRSDRAYYWSVQAVDNGFAGSPFAVERVVPAS